MPKKSIKTTIHKARMKAIRPFVTFNYDLRKPLPKTAKAKIKKYFERIDPLTARNFKVYRSKDASKLKKVRDFSGHTPELNRLPALKPIAFVPVSDPKAKARIKVGKTVKIKYESVITEIIPLETKKLIKGVEKHVKESIAKYAPNAKQFNIAVGDSGIYEIASAVAVGDRENIHKKVIFFMERYDDKKENNYWGNWLFGLKAYEFKKQADWREFRKEWNTARKEKEDKRKKHRRKFKRLKGK